MNVSYGLTIIRGEYQFNLIMLKFSPFLEAALKVKISK